MTEHILFVFEGEKTESQIFENLLLHFFNYLAFIKKWGCAQKFKIDTLDATLYKE